MIVHHIPAVISPLSVGNETMIVACSADNQLFTPPTHANYVKVSLIQEAMQTHRVYVETATGLGMNPMCFVSYM